MTRKPIVGGNWKMNKDLRSASELSRRVIDGIGHDIRSDVVVFPPYPYLMAIGAILRERQSAVRLGAQNVWPQPDGAFTGEISASMLVDCGVHAVLVGHSERRHVVGEPDHLINQKARAVLDAGLECVLCIGETLEQHDAGETDAINERQLRAGLSEIGADAAPRLTIAYEPVWAIGTGRTATPADAQNAHAHVRATLASIYSQGVAQSIRIQYGGSVKPGNAAELFAQADIDGGLIGGASLEAADFCQIVRAAG